MGSCLRCNRDVYCTVHSPDLVLAYGTSANMRRRISSHLANIALAVILPFGRTRHSDEEV